MSCRFNLYRDNDNRMLFGVCAGIADRFELNPTGVRVIAVVGLILWTVPVALLYLAASMLLRDRPLRYRGREDEHTFWRGGIERR